MPRPGFPKTLREFQSRFATEEACQQYLASCRWPDGFVCPQCGNQRAYELANLKRWKCAACRYQASLTAGTILHNTKTPLTVWFWAAYLMTTDKRGLSALLLQRQLALPRYETAWMMLHKFRRAMINLKREPLRGEVEVDDTWVGGTQAGLRGSRQLKGRKAALVLAAVEKRGRNLTGRARMAVIPDFRRETLLAFLKDNIAPGSTYTGGLKSFSGLKEVASNTCHAFNGCEPICERTRNRSCLWQTARLAISSSGYSEPITVSVVISSRFTSMNSYSAIIGARRQRRHSKPSSVLEQGVSQRNTRRYAGHLTWAIRLSRPDHNLSWFVETTG